MNGQVALLPLSDYVEQNFSCGKQKGELMEYLLSQTRDACVLHRETRPATFEARPRLPAKSKKVASGSSSSSTPSFNRDLRPNLITRSSCDVLC